LTRRIVPRPLRRWWRIAWDANITGLAAMIAYNMLLGIVPIALLALFVGGRVLASTGVQQQVIFDMREVFPGTAEHTLDALLDEVQRSTTGIGVLAIVSSLWLASSFWGALDTAFSRIYDSPARSWLRQRRFALSMVFVVLLFMIATVSVPTLQSILRSGARALPFGLAHLSLLISVGSLTFGLVLLFVCLAIIYYRVPNFRVPWRAVWPGTLGATLAIGIVDYGFPLYLSHVSTIARFGSAVVFVIILLGWFYLLAIIILGGAIVNALRMRPPPSN
jgi:membrane protein